MSFSIIGIGEVLWDLLPTGPQLGGAPANFAYQAQALGADAQVLTRIGQDQLGREVLDYFKQKNLSTETIQIDEQWPTGTVEITLSEQGVPKYHFPDNVAWDHIEVSPLLLESVANADAICFGTLAQRHPNSRAAIQQYVAATSPHALRIFDINLRQNFYSKDIIETSLYLATMLKLNDEELAVLKTMFILGGDIREVMIALANVFELQTVVLTCGAEGSLVYHLGEWSELESTKLLKVVDTVGAGDAFTAGLTVGILSGKPLSEVHRQADVLARLVCGQAGGV